MTRYRGKVTKKPDPLAELSYEQCRDELIAIVSKLEAGTATLDESMTQWERGEALAKRCEEFLDGAQQTIEAATSGADV